MIRMLLTVLMLVSSSAVSQEWQRLDPYPQGRALNSVYMLSPSTGWAVGDFGIIRHTTDGGTTWGYQNCGVLSRLNGVHFFNAWAGLVISEDGGLYVTDNGGDSWWCQESFPAIALRRMFVIGTDIWIVGSSVDVDGSHILHSSDEGATWVQQYAHPHALNALWFTDLEHGYAAGLRRIVRTTDGGVTWVPDLFELADHDFESLQFTSETHVRAISGGRYVLSYDGGYTFEDHSPPNTVLHDLYFVSDLVGWAVGGNPSAYSNTGYVFRTTDAGANWTVQDSSARGVLYDIAAFGPTALCAAGEHGTVMHTANAEDWSRQTGTDWCPERLNQVSFADSLHGFVVDFGMNCDSGRVLCTRDGGVSWRVATLPWSSASVYAVNSQTVWVGCDSGYVAHSDDGGFTWQLTPSGSPNYIKQIQFLDDSVGWAVPSYAGLEPVLHTTDGGHSWSRQDWVEHQNDVFNFRFVDAQNGWHSEGDGNFYRGIRRTTDGGDTWVTQDSTYVAVPLTFTDLNHGWGVYDQHVMRTVDGGAHWELVSILPVMERQICFTDTLNGHILNAWGSFNLGTTDGGLTWNTEPRGASGWTFLYDMDWPDVNHGWSVGEESFLLKWDATPPPPSTATAPHAALTTYALAAWPNPFNPNTTIAFDVPRAEHVTLAVYDLTGRLVQTLADQTYAAGSYRITFDGARLSSGVYFARLQGPSVSTARKLILLK